jgi:peptidoglycan/LPS O-acetylase OafA/YrhL
VKSSSGEHYIALDHIRAFAVLLVFFVHFLHGRGNGYPVPLEFTPAWFLFPFSILNRGQTGVALFMTLSGYLFAKLLDGKQVNYPAFFWNRALRLFPLLFLVIAVRIIEVRYTGTPREYMIFLAMVKQGFIKPTWPNGAWSVVAELHFYILLPVILFLARKSMWLLPAIVLAAVALRLALHLQTGSVEHLAYFTIVGRIDQFVLGILAFNCRKAIAFRHLLVALVLAAFLLFYWQWNSVAARGVDPSLLSPGAIWIILPTIEGLAFSLLVAYYDNSYQPSNTGVSRVIGLVGAYSYSIYLLHFFAVWWLAEFIDKHIMSLANFYVASTWSLLCFMLMLPVGYLSFRYIESPFLKFRRRYTIAPDPPPIAAGL